MSTRPSRPATAATAARAASGSRRSPTAGAQRMIGETEFDGQRPEPVVVGTREAQADAIRREGRGHDATEAPRGTGDERDPVIHAFRVPVLRRFRYPTRATIVHPDA